MATAEQLLVRIDASTESLRRELARADRSINEFGGRADRSLKQVDGAFAKLNAAMSTFGRALGPLVAGLAVREMGRFGAEIAKTADQLRLLEARVRVLGGTGQTFEQLRQVSLKLGTSVESTANAFSRFRIAGDDIGLTNKQVITLTETVQKLGRIGGATGAELASSTLQFAQGLAKGRLDGDELRSVLEGMPLLGRAIAESLGVGVGQLRDMGAAGELTGKVISDAVLGVAQETDEQFKRLPRTLEQASTNLETEWGRLVTALDDRLSVSQTFQFFTESLAGGVRAAADIVAGPTVQERLRSTLEQVRAIQEQIERTEQQSSRPSERGFADPRRVESDRTAAQRIARLKEEAAALAELLEREAVHVANAERLEQIERQAVATKQTQDRAKAVDDMVAALQREVDVLRLSEVERAKIAAADKAEAAARKNITGVTEEQIATIRDAAAASAAEGLAIEKTTKKREADDKALKALKAARVETIEGLQSELSHVTELAAAHEMGAEAVYAVETARKAELIIQRLKLEDTDIEIGLVTELIEKIEQQRAAIEKTVDAQKEAERAAEKLARAQEKAAEDAVREYEKVIDRIRDFSEEALGDSFFDILKGETVDFAEFFETTILRALANVLAAAATQQIVMPIATSVVGAVPGLFGLTGQAAGVAQSAGGGLFGGNNPLSSISNIFGGNGFNNFAMSGIGQSLGLSYGAGTLATAPGMFFAGGAVPGAIAASPALTLAATGPAGGFGALAGISTASTGGAVGAATAGGALATSGGLTAAGSSLAAIAGPLAAAAAIAIPILMGMFGGGPTVGPVGIADFSPGLGRRRAFDVPGIDPFTADNGGNGEAMRPIAEAIADLIADSADRFSATIEQSLRFRVANYQGPESGSGRAAGFEVNAFINQEAERRVAEGLSQEQAIFEALQFAVKEAFTFESATIAEAAANVSATTTEELLGKLEFADSFERMVIALDELGQGINVNTLTLAQNTVAVQDQAREFIEGAAGPIVDSLKTALELFPAEVTRQENGRRSVRSVLVGRVGEDERYLNPGDTGYDAAIDAPGARVLDRIIGFSEEVTAQAENYAANLERIRDATGIAVGSVDQLIQQITGEFEPAVRGPFTEAFDQGRARIEEFGSYIEKVNDQIRTANEAFPELDQALIDTTTVLVDAATALEATLRADYADSITRQLNAATGLGAVNVINDLLDSRDANIADAIALGVSADPASKLFDAQIRQALGGASLGEINALLSSGQITDQQTIASITAAMADTTLPAFQAALQSSIASIDSEIAKRSQSVDTLTRAITGLQQGRIGRAINPELSIFDPQEQFRIALEEFNRVATAAQGGDLDAVSRFDSAAESALQAALTAFGRSDERFAAVFNQIQTNSIGVESIAVQQLGVEQQQLSALQAIHAALSEQAGVSTRNFGAKPVRNQAIAALFPEFTADFGGGAFDSFRHGVLSPNDPRLGTLAELERTINFAMGGIMTSHGSLPLNRYAGGGIADSPQLAMFGEGRMPEAYVPLPDGRSIPVTMRMPVSGPANDQYGPQIVSLMSRMVDLMDASIRVNGAGDEEQVEASRSLTREVRELRDEVVRVAAQR